MKEMHHHCGTAASLYESLSAAVADINEGVIRVQRPEGGKVAVSADRSGRAVLRLLEDVTESAQLQIQTDAKLVLDGHNLTFTGDGCLTFAAGTDCEIDGRLEGSTIRKTLTAEAAGRYLIRTAGDHLLVRGGAYLIEGYYPQGFMAIRATDTCKLLEVQDCQVSAAHEGDQTDTGVRAIQTQAQATVLKNVEVTAQSGCYAHAVFGQGDIRIQGGSLSANADSAGACAVWSVGGVLGLNGSSATATSERSFSKAIYCTVGGVDVVGSTVTANSASGAAYAVFSSGETVALRDSSFDACSQKNYASTIYSGCAKVTTSACTVHAVTHGDTRVTAFGVEVLTGCTLKAETTDILADAKGTDATEDPIAIAVKNQGTAFLKDVTAKGTHSGVQNDGGAKLYVSGGTYAGYCHGGIYLGQGENGEAYVNDAAMVGGTYEGIFDYTQNTDKLGALYVGGTPGTIAYLDGCSIDGTGTDDSVVLRGTDQEADNTLNLSNCTLADQSAPVRVDDGMRMNVGMGGNIAAFLPNEEGTDLVADGRVVLCTESYRRHHDDELCDGRDYAALMALIEAKASA